MKNVVAYVRVSSASQIENTSIETQIEKIELHCKLHDIEINKIFKDEGISAKDTENRSSYNKMLEYILDKKLLEIFINNGQYYIAEWLVK